MLQKDITGTLPAIQLNSHKQARLVVDTGGYSGVIRVESGVRDRSRHGPLMPTIDAVFLHALSDGTMQYLAARSLVVTLLYMNLMNHNHVPTVLTHIVDYGKTDHGARAIDRSVEEMENVHIISLKTPYTLEKRLHTFVSGNKHTTAID